MLGWLFSTEALLLASLLSKELIYEGLTVWEDALPMTSLCKQFLLPHPSPPISLPMIH